MATALLMEGKIPSHIAAVGKRANLAMKSRRVSIQQRPDDAGNNYCLIPYVDPTGISMPSHLNSFQFPTEFAI